MTKKLTHNPFGALNPGAKPPPAQPAAPPPPPDPAARFGAKVVVRHERKGRGGKTVTRISGVKAAHRDAICAAMKKGLGCGALVEKEEVILLGDLVDRAVKWLEANGADKVIRGT